jgi:hypothetical protein
MIWPLNQSVCVPFDEKELLALNTRLLSKESIPLDSCLLLKLKFDQPASVAGQKAVCSKFFFQTPRTSAMVSEGEVEEFSIPQKPDELLDAKGSYCVEEIELSDALQALDGANGPCAPACCFVQRQ